MTMISRSFAGAFCCFVLLCLGGCPEIELPQINPGNRPPAANAGPNISTCVGELVRLDGSGSTDPDGDSLGYSWIQTSGTNTAFAGATSMQPTFTPQSPGTYEFSLTVTDGRGGSSSDTVRVQVDTCGENTGGGGNEEDDGAGGDGNGGGGGDGNGGGTVPPSGASLSLNVAAFPDPVRRNESTTYRIILGNDGIVDLHNVTITTSMLGAWSDFSPESQDVLCSTGSHCYDGAVITWPAGDMPAGSTQSFLFSPRNYHRNLTDGDVIAVALNANSLQGVTATALRMVTARDNPLLSLGVVATPARVSINKEVKVTLTIGIISAHAAENARLRAALPQGTQFVSATESGSVVNNHVEWELGPLSGGTSMAHEFVFRLVDNTVPAGRILISEAELSSRIVTTGFPTRTARAQALIVVE